MSPGRQLWGVCSNIIRIPPVKLGKVHRMTPGQTGEIRQNDHGQSLEIPNNDHPSPPHRDQLHAEHRRRMLVAELQRQPLRLGDVN